MRCENEPIIRRNMEQRENYHGLLKQGTTCYLNSVLQVLFMTPEFRQAVTRSVKDDPNSDFIDPQLKEMFDRLLQNPTDTHEIRTTLHIDKVFEQQDAAEYLEKILKQTSPNAAKIFHGQMVHRTTCSVCKKGTDAAGPFWLLPLELLSENYSVESGIQEFFKTSELSGENQMYCEPCNTKVISSTKYVMKHHPDVLVLLLKRFEFSYRSRSYAKICCDVDVPYTLNIPQDQPYELYAVVDHFGDLRGGHYAATIKSQDERWFCFDEDRVTPFSYNPFPDNKNVATSSRAYLLFYRKKDSGLDSVDKHTSEDHSSTKDIDLQLADKERSTNVKTKRKELVKDGHQERWDSTTAESKIKKPKQEKRGTKRNKSKEKTIQTEKKGMNDPESDQSESDNPHSQRRKPLNKKPDCDKGLVDQEMRNVKLNVRQKDKKKRQNKNQKTDADPDVSASERRERPTGNQAAERREEKKKGTIQTNTNRGLEEAADRGHISEKSKLKVKKITETKKMIHTDITSKPLIVKTVEEISFFIEEDRGNRNTDHESDLNTTNISFPTCSVDQTESLQSDVSRLKDYRGVKLEVPDQNSQKKNKFWDKFQRNSRKIPEFTLRGNV